MKFESVSLKSMVFLILLKTFVYRKLATDATRVVNVRNTHKLLSRSLLFPPTAPTRVQFIGGIGIPVEALHFESVTSGYVLKAEYLLPETAEDFRQKLKPQSIHRRRRTLNDEGFKNASLFNEMEKNSFINETLNYKNQISQPKSPSSYRWVIYEAIETILKKSKLNGHACMLRSICEHAALPLSYEGGLLAEILHIILTPSTSHDEVVTPSHRGYMKAEILGRSGEDCEKAFIQCSKSPMQLISAVFEKSN